MFYLTLGNETILWCNNTAVIYKLENVSLSSLLNLMIDNKGKVWRKNGQYF